MWKYEGGAKGHSQASSQGSQMELVLLTEPKGTQEDDPGWSNIMSSVLDGYVPESLREDLGR